MVRPEIICLGSEAEGIGYGLVGFWSGLFGEVDAVDGSRNN